MVAGIDVGNTHIKLFDFKSNKKLATWETHNVAEHILHNGLKPYDEIIISSVSKLGFEKIVKIIKSLKIKSYIVDKNKLNKVKLGSYINEIGIDRVTSIYGALYSYDTPFCIVDMGTATTISVINDSFEYVGGLIMPGVGTMFNSLHQYTSDLPQFNLKEVPVQFLGNTTKDNIVNGIYYLVSEGLKGILNNVKMEVSNPVVIGTGGWANYFKKYYDFIDYQLIFKGLKNIYSIYVR